jgi:hypothetical protein
MLHLHARRDFSSGLVMAGALDRAARLSDLVSDMRHRRDRTLHDRPLLAAFPAPFRRLLGLWLLGLSLGVPAMLALFR